MATADYHYPDWECLADFFSNPGLKNCWHGWPGIEPTTTTLDLSSQSGAYDLSASATRNYSERMIKSFWYSCQNGFQDNSNNQVQYRLIRLLMPLYQSPTIDMSTDTADYYLLDLKCHVDFFAICSGKIATVAVDWTHNLRYCFSIRCLWPLSHSDHMPLSATWNFYLMGCYFARWQVWWYWEWLLLARQLWQAFFSRL